MAFESLKTTFLAGLGLAVITAEQASRAVQGFVDAGRITAEQAESLVRELMTTGREQSKSVRENMAEAVQAAVDAMDLPSGPQTKRLERRVEALEERLQALEALLQAQPAAGRSAAAESESISPEDRQG